MNIKGKYEFDILIQNMFNSYHFTIKNHNIVTKKGLDFILQCCINQQNKHFGNVCVGTNSTKPTIDDTVSNFTITKEFNDANVTVDDNDLIYTIQLKGSDIHNTTEIGIFSENKDILITRDVHDRYDIPTDAQITLKYTLSITNEEKEILGEEEEGEELYD